MDDGHRDAYGWLLYVIAFGHDGANKGGKEMGQVSKNWRGFVWCFSLYAFVDHAFYICFLFLFFDVVE